MKHWSYILTTLLLLTSCTKQPSDPAQAQAPDGTALVTLGNIKINSTPSTPQANTQPNTKATDALPAGSTLRLYALHPGETDLDLYLINTRTYTVDAGGTPILDAGQEPLYLPLGPVDIYLIGPVRHNTGTNETPNWIDIATANAIKPTRNVDLIAGYTSADIAFGAANSLPPIVLTHKMARLQVLITKHENGTYEDLKLTQVKLHQQPTTATFALGTDGGTILPTTSTDNYITPQIDEEHIGERYSTTTLLFPQPEKEFTIEATFNARSLSPEGGVMPSIKPYRQTGHITLNLAPGTATRCSSVPLTPLELIWRIKIMPWDDILKDTLITPGIPTSPPTVDPANSYIVAPGKTVVFDARIQGNGGAGAVKMAPKSVQVLWQTGDGRVPLIESVSMGANGEATVQTNSAVAGGGNAVIAAYDGPNGTGDILWSWHIWVTDYNPVGQTAVAQNTAYTVPGGQVHTYGTNFMAKNPGKVIMDRNLGATAATYAPPADVATGAKTFGMFYQWGRKDPLPSWDGVNTSSPATIKIYGPDGTTALTEGAKDDATAAGYKKVSVATAGGAGPNLSYAVKNPLSFIYGSADPYDWYTSTNNNSAQNNDLWGDGAAKSIYDPCPKGWRIAPNGTWSDFGTNAYAAPFFYYIKGVKQTASGTPAFVQSGRNGRFYEAGAVKAWYPAPGFRDAGSRAGGEGALWHVGYYGFSWSSSVSGIYGMTLGFHYGGLVPSGADRRGCGFQVRCLQE